MIKLPPALRSSAAIAVAFTALCGASLCAAPVDNWIQNNGTAASELDTNHPIIGTGVSDSVKNQQMYAVTQAYTLSDVGDSLTLSGNANFQGVTGADSNQLRFGIYDSNGSSNANGWLGYFAGNGGSGGNPNSFLWKRQDGSNTSFGGGAGADVAEELTGWPITRVLSDGDYSFSMVLTKTEEGMNVVWAITGLTGGSDYVLSGSYNDLSPNAITFDRVGIFTGSLLNAAQLSFSDFDLTFSPAIPEPSTTAAVLGFVVVGALLLRRRAKRNA